MYAGDNDDRTVVLDQNGDPQGGQVGHRTFVLQRLYPYVKNDQVFYDASTGVNGTPHTYTTAEDPSTFGAWQQYHNLSFNHWGLFGWYNPADNPSRDLSNQDDIAERAAIISTTYPGAGDPWGWYSFLNYYTMDPNYADKNDFWRNEGFGATKRHRDGTVTAFADGHAARVAAGKIYKPKGSAQSTIDWYSANEKVKNYWGYWYSATE